jgi:chemotaxis protein histidine kinase CheA
MTEDELKSLLGNPQAESEAVQPEAVGDPPQAEALAVQDDPQPQSEPQAEPEQTPRAPERAPDGKFKAKAKDEPEPGHVPINALLEERDKRKAAQEATEAYKRRLEALEQERQAQTPADPLAAVHAELYKQRVEMSRNFAEQRYGEDKVREAFEWANARCEPTSPHFDPLFNQQVFESGNPYDFAVKAFEKEQILQEVKPDELAEFKAWKAAQAQAQAHAAPVSTPAASPPPKSLATAPGNGGAGKPLVNIGPGEAFASVIPR